MATGPETASATPTVKINPRSSPIPSATERPTVRTLQPATLATVPPTLDGRPARFTDVLESGARNAPHAVQYGKTPR
jgi:hypothetical protein